MERKDWLALVIAIVVSHIAGVIGSVFTISSVNSWYAALIKPDFSPPSFVFAPVWLTLYTLMGVAVFLVYKQGLQKKAVKFAVAVFAIQLALNALWSYLFFGLHNPFLAFIEILFLWIAILVSIILFYRISKPAAYLLLPYLAWVSFAAILNYFIWILNV